MLKAETTPINAVVVVCFANPGKRLTAITLACLQRVTALFPGASVFALVQKETASIKLPSNVTVIRVKNDLRANFADGCSFALKYIPVSCTHILFMGNDELPAVVPGNTPVCLVDKLGFNAVDGSNAVVGRRDLLAKFFIDWLTEGDTRLLAVPVGASLFNIKAEPNKRVYVDNINSDLESWVFHWFILQGFIRRGFTVYGQCSPSVSELIDLKFEEVLPIDLLNGFEAVVSLESTSQLFRGGCDLSDSEISVLSVASYFTGELETELPKLRKASLQEVRSFLFTVPDELKTAASGKFKPDTKVVLYAMSDLDERRVPANVRVDLRALLDSQGFSLIIGTAGLTPDLLAGLGFASLVIAESDGYAHIAALSGKPVLVISGPTNDRLRMSIYKNVTTMWTKGTCARCEYGDAYRPGCPFGCQELASIPATEIFGMAMRMLKSAPREKPVWPPGLDDPLLPVAFTETYHCRSMRHCAICRNRESGRDFRERVSRLFDQTDGPDFACPFNKPWVEEPSVAVTLPSDAALADLLVIRNDAAEAIRKAGSDEAKAKEEKG